MTAIFALMFIIGLVIGSFLNVVILRTVSNESIVFPGSKCPKCQTPLKWYHNIPVISYLFLRGKCAFCHEKISIQYPLVEFLTGVIFLAFTVIYFNFSYASNKVLLPVFLIMCLFSLICSSLLIVISGTDIKEMKVSDAHTYSLIAMSFIYSITIGLMTFIPDIKYGIYEWKRLFIPVGVTLFAVVISFLLMEGLRRGLNYLLSTETFGDGDSYIFSGITGVLTALSGITNLSYITLHIIGLFILSVLISVICSFPSYIKQLINTKKWPLLTTLVSFIVYAIFYFVTGHLGVFENNVVLLVATLIIVLLGLTLCFKIISSIKEKKEPLMTIPFGPALCASGLIALFAIPFTLGII